MNDISSYERFIKVMLHILWQYEVHTCFEQTIHVQKSGRNYLFLDL